MSQLSEFFCTFWTTPFFYNDQDPEVPRFPLVFSFLHKFLIGFRCWFQSVYIILCQPCLDHSSLGVFSFCLVRRSTESPDPVWLQNLMSYSFSTMQPPFLTVEMVFLGLLLFFILLLLTRSWLANRYFQCSEILVD